ncbi:MAG: branched-chain amino acid ABC transporter permease [Clostridia bacterium]|nr:branched-chain amino acid ABC transporter permease [Clostridia bacterium]MCL6521323.1 branched-chain amino acid ABC transporter permease [Bacillota bacterium]
MSGFLELLLNGVTLGSVYALVALGYTMVYGVLRLINFAHGDLFALGAYLAFSLMTASALSSRLAGPGGLVVVLLLVMLFVALAGALTERIAYRPLRRSSRLAPVVSALGVSVFLENAIMLVYGPDYRVFPHGFLPQVVWSLGAGVHVALVQLLIIVVSLALMVALYLFVQRTTVGAAIRAVALDHDTARLMGIDVDRIILLVFLIGPALGGAAGLMVGSYYGQISFQMGWGYGLKAFTAAIIGGIGNIPGAMVGGLLLGVLEALGAGYISSAWQGAITFLVLILILIARPTGLLGERVVSKL